MSLLSTIQSKPRTKGEKKTKSNAEIGEKFESEIKATCELYQFMKVAWIQKFEVPKRWIPPYLNKKTGKKGGGMMMYTAKTGFDFVGGIIQPEKNAIFIECKSTKQGNIPLWQDDQGIKRHQIETMQWLENFGFVCLFLWQIRTDPPIVYKFTPRELISGVAGSKVLTINDCNELKFVRMAKIKKGAREYYDFLGLI